MRCRIKINQVFSFKNDDNVRISADRAENEYAQALVCLEVLKTSRSNNFLTINMIQSFPQKI